MNTVSLKKTFLTTLLLSLSAHASISAAVSVTGSLGSVSSATDFYRVTCSKNVNGDTLNLKVTLLDLAPVAAPIISVQAVKGIYAANTSDAVDGDANASPAAIPAKIIKGVKYTNSGNGIYDVRVNKTAAGTESYKLNATCLSSAGKPTGTVISTPVQNQ